MKLCEKNGKLRQMNFLRGKSFLFILSSLLMMLMKYFQREFSINQFIFDMKFHLSSFHNSTHLHNEKQSEKALRVSLKIH